MLASVLIELTPGPNMTWLAILTLGEGRRQGLKAVAGIGLGLGLLGLRGAFGVSGLIASSPLIYEILRWAGIAFLLYLAWEGFRGEADAEGGASRYRAFYCGLISNLLNPKAALFYVTALPVFITPDRPVLPQTLILTAGYVVVATAIHAGIVLLASRLQPFLRTGDRARITRFILSSLLVVVAVWFAISTLQA